MATEQQTVSLKMVPLPQPAIISQSPAPLEYVVGKLNAFPCRRCLQDGAIGDKMYLISYDPFAPTANSSPYKSDSPIFIHAHDCTPYSGSEVQEQQLRRFLSIRAFNKDHMMINAGVLPGEELAAKAKAMLADGNVDYLHVHNAAHGCFAVKIERE